FRVSSGSSRNGSFTIPPENLITIPSGSTRVTVAFLNSLPLVILKSSARETDARQTAKQIFESRENIAALLTTLSLPGEAQKQQNPSREVLGVDRRQSQESR